MDGRERRVRHRRELDVVVADDSDVVGRTQAAQPDPADDADRQQVVRAEDRRRRWPGEERLYGCETRSGVHRLHLDLDQIALRVEPGIAQRCEEAEPAVLALRDRDRTVDERNASMTELQEVLAGQPAAEDVVDDDGRDVAGGATVIEQHERDPAVGQPLDVTAGPVISNFPIWMAETQRIPALALPDESPEDVLDLARAFPRTHLLVIVGRASDHWPGDLETHQPGSDCFTPIDLGAYAGPGEDPLATTSVYDIRCAAIRL